MKAFSRQRSKQRGRRDFARLLAARILSLPGVEGKRSRWTTKNAYYIGSREFAHFHDAREVDVRLTRKVQREHAHRLRNDPRVKFRERPSEWVTLSLRKPEDAGFAFEIQDGPVDAPQGLTSL